MKKYKILVVDNQPLFLEFMMSLLSNFGHIVKTAKGGLDAITLARTFEPEIIFIDLVMPHINGYRLCRILREFPNLKDLLIVIISGIAAERTIISDESLADVYIAKGPFMKVSKHVQNVIEHYDNDTIAELKGLVLGIDDIYHREVTKELLFAEKHLNVLLSTMEDGVIEFLEDFRIVYVNKAAEKIFDKTEFRMLAQDIRHLVPDKFIEKITNYVIEDIPTSSLIGEEEPFLINNSYIHMILQTVHEPPNKSYLAILRDISRFKLAEQRLRESLRVKEMLLKEIHHRVKNNLGIISSMLNLQKMTIQDPQYHVYLDDISGRIHSIELIHEKLYQSDDFKLVDLSSYLADLTTMIVQTITDSRYGVEVKIKGSDILVPIQTAIPLGLITAEVVTNAVKYGFGILEKNPFLKDKTPSITISISSGTKPQLIIMNNGYPFPDEIDPTETDSLGINLISDLANQLSGKYGYKAFEQNGESGTEFSLFFTIIQD